MVAELGIFKLITDGDNYLCKFAAAPLLFLDLSLRLKVEEGYSRDVLKSSSREPSHFSRTI